ncbi:DUF4041 domain-containing protein [Pelagibaculum spongiae]|uniref:DUF4041 domain-containing protein n=1 Tax=Pelagibaculum spongiae TaxID=2080658 RepID=A0A2V1H2X8_9GAMM|nr:DUF4041 domain-containing protein [Pelagibaculum spongiae]PVZ71527.1 DUF4041 domain-containing protein [Pelagibaculum spongiae]
MSKIRSEVINSKEELSKTNIETRSLQLLKSNAEELLSKVKENETILKSIEGEIRRRSEDIANKDNQLHKLVGSIDLYSRMNEYVANGFFEMPEYLHETSARFSEEIKRVRQKQKNLIKDKEAIKYPISTIVMSDKSYNKKILDGQVKLMLNSFNIECDFLIGKVSPGSFARTLERIEKIANSLESSAVTLHCGFNIEYVKLKYEECKLQYQYTLKKQEEQDEQRLIREQIREEQKAIKEYERAILQAEKEEKMYRHMLEKAREELSKVSDEGRIVAEQRIADLEQQLADAEAKEERAKSMAEQTRKGHVYVISNVGSFGDDVYKIGLTRRLEPMDRVKELGGASVPFSFDVHAMIYVEDAPALESALHREFTQSRVNAVNLRKEFFRTDLHSIKKAVERIAGVDTEFKMTALAEDYYESRCLQGIKTSVA